MDRYENHSPSLVSPATDGANVAPSDGADLAQVTRALYVGQGGDLSLRLASGSEGRAGRGRGRHAAAGARRAGARHRDHRGGDRRALVEAPRGARAPLGTKEGVNDESRPLLLRAGHGGTE